MRFLNRFMSEDMTNETSSDSFCNLDCVEGLRDLGYCSSSICSDKCPTMCKIVVVTGLSPPPMIHHDDNLKRILIIAASTIMTTLFLFTLLVLCFKIYNRRRSMAISRSWSMEVAANWGGFDGPSVPVIVDHPVWHIRTIGLNPSVISSIKVYKYSKKDGFVEGTDCSICLSEFEEEETLRLLPKCKHAFHLSCIDTWLRSHTNCPLCRAPIVVDDDDGDSEDQEVILVRIPEENEEIDEDHEEEEEDGFVTRDGETDEQRVRRSVSLGSFSSIRVSEVGKEKVKRSNTGSSIVERSSFFKRSISYNGK